MRDNFSERTKKLLAEKAGYICSYPQCRVRTKSVGAHDACGLCNVGQAAHITAASPGGPRYESSLTPKERRAESNGIWLCSTHAKLIDSVPSRYDADTLRMWKQQHERDVQNKWFNLANTSSSGVCRYIQELTVSGLGPFISEEQFHFGRINFFVGRNGVGKTALMQMASWFVGGAAHEQIRERFLKFCGSDIAKLAIKYGEKKDACEVRYVWEKKGPRLVINADKSILENALVVKCSQRALVVQDTYESFTTTRQSTGFKHIVSGFAKLIGLDYGELLHLIVSRSDRVTSVGYKVKLSAKNRLLFKCNKNEPYQEYGSMSSTEVMWATIDIALRCIDLIPPSQSWLFVIEHNIVKRLSLDYGERFSDILFYMPPNIQLMVCALDEETVSGLINGREQSFEKSCVHARIGDLSVWTSHDAWSF